MRSIYHHLICEAPICSRDPNPNYKIEVIWYPGEKVCRKFPYYKFQKKQLSINILVKKGRFKNVDKHYTAYELENSCI
jgi:hypothetical protein